MVCVWMCVGEDKSKREKEGGEKGYRAAGVREKYIYKAEECKPHLWK